MAEASLFSVANRITLRLQEIGKSQGGLDHSLQQLEMTISRMQGVLLDAEKQHMQNLRQKNKFEVRDWLREIGDSFYNADDLVDEYYTETLRQSRSGNRMTKQMKHILKEVMDKLDAKYAAAADNTTGPCFHFEVRPEEQLPGVDEYDATELTSMDSYITRQIIGSDEDRKVITQRLFENKNDDVSVQTICGVAGSGKKEVARLVFNSEIVRGNFQLRMWVELSRDDFSDLGLVVEKIINSAAPPHKQVNRNSLPMKELQKRLRNEIKGKRFLLIFDAVRSSNNENWPVLKDLLTNGVQGNNIVVVTRSQEAANLMSGGRVLTISPVSYVASRILLNQVSVKQRQEPCNQKILERVRNNLDLWQGHPFIISVIERMFYFNHPEIEWSLLDEPANIFEEENNIVPPLRLWYYQLPSRLKHCFAFCSLFPKGYEMDVQTLIKFWMAHGFIELSDSQSMEAVGYQYFLQLLSRQVFEVVEKDELGNITKCTIYECMHDLAKFAAGNECKLLRANEANASQELSRHVSFNYPLDSSRPEIPRSLHETKGIRTILLCNQSLEGFQGRSRRKSICDKFVSHFKLLRMLDLHNSGLKEVPSSIGKLKHLRYLDLSENKDIVKLPASIAKLQNLQTLKLSSCYGLRKWPKGLRKLVNLRHLEFDWCYNLTRMPRGLGQLTNLQTLSEVVLTKRTDELSELKHLNNLRGALKITKLKSGIQSESANLEGKQHLSSLMLTWDFSSNDGDATAGVEKTLEGLKPHPNLRELALVGYEGVKFSSWLSSLTRLVKFSLRRSKCQHIPPLSQLTSLKILILDEMTSLEDISDGSMNESSPLILPSLEELRLSKLPDLRDWWPTPSSSSPSMVPSFPRLSKLIIEDCPKLNLMPRCPNLKEWLVLDNTNWEPLRLILTSNNARSPLMQVESSSSSSSSPALSKLRSLSIIGIEELDNSNAEAIDWTAFKSLHFLRLDYLLKLEVLPDGLQHVIGLKELHIWRCNIKTIPEWISELRSLQRLSIWACPYLTSLPEGIRSLTSLETLEIGECPILLQRCQRGTGADWDKIAHIGKKSFPWRQSFSLNSYFKNP